MQQIFNSNESLSLLSISTIDVLSYDFQPDTVGTILEHSFSFYYTVLRKIKKYFHFNKTKYNVWLKIIHSKKGLSSGIILTSIQV